MDRRITPANARVAASALKGTVKAKRYWDGIAQQIVGHPFLLSSPDGPRDRQLLWGDDFQVFESHEGWVFGQSAKDDYVGYLPEAAVADPIESTHRVSQRETWFYETPDFKKPALGALQYSSRVRVLGQEGNWSRVTFAGCEKEAYVPRAHIQAFLHKPKDIVAEAEKFLGTPYVWAGNSGRGIDCSGLVQAALLACGIGCPGDSDQQQALGHNIPDSAPLVAGDLLFWKGHVAMAVDPKRIIHANAHHMCVSYEVTDDAIARIKDQGDGPVVARKRL